MSAGTGGTISGCGNYLKDTASTKVVLADCEGSVLHSKITDGVAFTREMVERGVKLNRYDTICEGIGEKRVSSSHAPRYELNIWASTSTAA